MPPVFIDSSKRSRECVLLHNGNQFASVPIAHSTTLKKHEALKDMLEKIGYDQHKWFICVDPENGEHFVETTVWLHQVPIFSVHV